MSVFVYVIIYTYAMIYTKGYLIVLVNEIYFESFLMNMWD